MAEHEMSRTRAPRPLVRATALLCGVVAGLGGVVALAHSPGDAGDLPFEVVIDGAAGGAAVGEGAAPAGFVRVDAAGHGFSIAVPSTWELDDADFYGGLAASGERGGEEDIVLVASDPLTEGSTHVSLARLAANPSVAGEGFAQSVRAALESTGAVGVSVEPVVLRAGAAVRSRFSLLIAPPAADALDCTQYYIDVAGEVWMLSLFSDDPVADAAKLDQIASSLAFVSR